MNAVKKRFNELIERNYVRKADPDESYWFDWKSRKVEKIRQATGGDFYFILHGSPSIEKDFFVIPYGMVKDMLTDDNLTKSATGEKQNRWMGRIFGNTLKINHSRGELDLTPYKGNLSLLDHAIRSNLADGTVDLTAEEADLSVLGDEIVAPFVPDDADSRSIVVQQIKARRGQQAFRNALRNRYGGVCLISGCHLLDVLEAAHIKPYRGTPDNHPANGLLLRADIHTLFDLDLIGIEPKTLIVWVNPSAAGYEIFDGAVLKCGLEKPSLEALFIRWKVYQRKLARTGRIARPSKKLSVLGRPSPGGYVDWVRLPPRLMFRCACARVNKLLTRAGRRDFSVVRKHGRISPLM